MSAGRVAGAAVCTLMLAARVAAQEPAPARPAAISHAQEIVGLVRDLYARRDNRALWIEATGKVSDQAWRALEVLRNASDDALDPRDYAVDEIERALRWLEEENPHATQAGRIDAFLTRAVVAYAHDLAHGRVEAADLHIVADLPPLALDVAGVVAEGVAERAIERALATLAPPQQGYRELRRMLAVYRAIAGAGGWPAVSADERMEPGRRYPRARVEALESRLAAESHVRRESRAPGRARIWRDEPEAVFDEGLEAAVRRFQSERGLAVDGVVGPETLAELNRSVADVVRRIEVNMELWRWSPSDLGRDHVSVNVPAFELVVTEAGREIMRSRVVVGRAAWGTPLFSEQIERIVLNPQWNVPDTITRREILPQVLRDRRALELGGFEIVTAWGPQGRVVAPDEIDWGSVTPGTFPYRLRQQPGPSNALGRLKFVFPNRFDVYLHDTPANALFAATRRASSHGCIRVERPLDLAAWLLRGDPRWTRASLDRAIRAGERRAIPVPGAVAIHILYFTAFVNGEGRLELREDLYGIDAKLERALDEIAAARPPAFDVLEGDPAAASSPR